MQVARRVYIYLVTFISLLVMLAGAVGLLQLLVELALGSSRGVLNDSGFVRQQFVVLRFALFAGNAAGHQQLGQVTHRGQWRPELVRDRRDEIGLPPRQQDLSGSCAV